MVLGEREAYNTIHPQVQSGKMSMDEAGAVGIRYAYAMAATPLSELEDLVNDAADAPAAPIKDWNPGVDPTNPANNPVTGHPIGVAPDVLAQWENVKQPPTPTAPKQSSVTAYIQKRQGDEANARQTAIDLMRRYNEERDTKKRAELLQMVTNAQLLEASYRRMWKTAEATGVME